MTAAHKFDPFEHGIYRRFLDTAGYLVTTAWNRAAQAGEHVGTCRWCGDYMLADPTHQQHEKLTWYGAHCTNQNCLHVIAAPNAAYLKRSSRHSEMPAGWWEKRIQNRKAN